MCNVFIIYVLIMLYMYMSSEYSMTFIIMLNYKKKKNEQLMNEILTTMQLPETVLMKFAEHKVCHQ